MTKHKPMIYILAVMALLMLATGCTVTMNEGSSSFGTIAYNALLVSKEAYVHNFNNFNDMYEQGLISDSAYEKGYDFANKYYNAWMTAMNSVIAYETIKDLPSKEKAKAMLGLLRTISKEAFNFLDQYIMPDKRMILKEVK